MTHSIVDISDGDITGNTALGKDVMWIYILGLLSTAIVMLLRMHYKKKFRNC